MKQILVNEELLRQMQALCMEVRQQSSQRMAALAIPLWEALRAALEQPAQQSCPTCGSDCNERDELIKAEREIERLHAENEALRAQAENARALAQPVCDLLGISILHDAPKAIEALRAALDQPGVEPVAKVIWPSASGLPTIEWLVKSSEISAEMLLFSAPQPAQQPDTRATAIQACIDRLVQGGKPAEAGMLRHHFAKDLGEE